MWSFFMVRANLGSVSFLIGFVEGTAMFEYDVRKSQRRCSVTDRVFEPGESYFSALMETDNGFERLDFSSEHWNEPSNDCVGWWHSRVPEKNQGRVYWAPNDVLIAYFEQLLAKQPDSNTTFVMGIALVRRKVLKMAPNENIEGQSFMILESTDGEKRFQVALSEPSQQDIRKIQDELSEQLFTDHVAESD